MTNFIKATDLYSLAECDRMVFLNHNGDKSLRSKRGQYQLYLAEQGEAFEQEVIADMDFAEPAYVIGDLETGWERTRELMEEGAKVIYQGVLMHDGVVGIPDLMFRVDEVPSRLGRHIYRPVDVKLASKSKKGHQMQVMCYTWLLERIQGVQPVGALYLRLSQEDPLAASSLYQEEIVPFDPDAFFTSLSEVRRLAAGEERKPFMTSVCKMCTWYDFCQGIAESTNDPSLLPGMRRTVWHALHNAGKTSIPDVLTLSREQLMSFKGVGEKVADTILRHAEALSTGSAVPIAAPKLPPSSDADIMFDIESIPADGFLYLMGVLAKRDDEWAYEYDLAEHPDDEEHMWEAFLQRIDALLNGSDGHVYHYGVYERSALNQMIKRYGEDPRAERLMSRLVDLEKVIRKSMALPLRSYSLKSVGPWLGFQWDSSTQSGGDSIVDYVQWLATGDRRYLDEIIHYNEEDCHATVAIRDWLHSLMEET